MPSQSLADYGLSSSQEAHEVQRAVNAQGYERVLRIQDVDGQLVHVQRGPLEGLHPASRKANHAPKQAPDMATRGAYDTSRANKRQKTTHGNIEPEPFGDSTTSQRIGIKRKQTFSESSRAVDDLLKPQSKRQRIAPNSQTPIFDETPDAVLDVLDDGEAVDATSPATSSNQSDKENRDHRVMDRPKLALKLSFAKQTDDFAKPATPATAASPPAQTPKLKLSLNKSKDEDGSGKKRKRADEGQGRGLVQTPSSAVPKIKIKPFGKVVAPSPVTPGGIKLQSKGKIPKRPAGVGYDSELSDTERDPVILEGFVLRMQPGPDCDYVKDHISKGTIGTFKMHGGADIGIIVLDDKGRRCILRVRQNKYAATLVDLPTVSEGMKSWDKNRFIKSIDVCQMMIVLGPIKLDEEAKTYPLPPDVNPKTYQYAHGLTAPMRWVRKRRFDRTKRTRVEEIEMVDQRVGALLAGDAGFQHVDFETLDYDPRIGDDQYSESESGDDEDEDAEGEEEDYFGPNEPTRIEEHVDEPDEAELNEFDQLFADEDMDETVGASDLGRPTNGTVDSSGFATSNADSPDVTGSLAPTSAATPAGDVSTPAAATPGTDGDNESDEDDDRDDREAQNEQDEQKSQLQDRISEIEGKIREQMGHLTTTTNQILKRRLAQKIKDLQTDVDMLKRELGNGGGDGGDEE